MLRLSLSATDEELINAIRAWVELLAQCRYEDAFTLTFHPPEDEMTPHALRALITHFGSLQPRSDGKTFRVTSLAQTRQAETSALCCVYRFGEERRWGLIPLIASIDFDLPLDGEWSNLTAGFLVMQYETCLVLYLGTIDVL